MVPARIERYRIEASLGGGGMGEVYKAYDERLGRWVALKTLPRHRLSQEQRRQLEQEARNLAILNHSAVAQIYDIVTVGESDYLVLEYVEGQTLQEFLVERSQQLPDALRLAMEVAEGLAAAHAAGMVHRDLKAENVVVTPAGHAKILDFGLAKLMPSGDDSTSSGDDRASSGDDRTSSGDDRDEAIWARGGIVGTLSAMSPEQVLHEEVDARSDLFALGTLLYQLLTGVHPFATGLPVETARRIVREHPRPPRELDPAIPDEVSALVERLLAKSPEDRPGSAAEVTAALRRQLQISGGLDESEAASSPDPGRRRWWRIAALVLVIVAALAAWWLSARQELPTISVAVTRPQIEVTDAADRLGAAAVAARVAVVNHLATLEGVYTLSFAEVDAVSGDPRQLAMATAADELLTTSLSPSGTGCRITLSRISGKDQRNIWVATFEVPQDDMRLLSDTVAAHLALGYGERHARSGAFSQTASPEDLRTFLELRSEIRSPTADTSWPRLMSQLEALRRSSPGLLSAYTNEVSIARYLYQVTLDEQYLEHARTVIDEARRLAPHDQRPLHASIELALAVRDVARAQQAITELERMDPGYPMLTSFKAYLAEQQGEVEEALRLLEEAYRRRPSWYQLLALAGVESRHGLAKEARDHIRKAFEIVPDNPTVLARLAEYEGLLGNLEQAEQLYLRLVFLSPQPKHLSGLGMTQLLLGRYEEAVETYHRVLERGARLPVHLLNLADCYSCLGRAEEARRLYQEALEVIDAQGSVSPTELGFKSQCLLHLGEVEAARDVAHKALAQAPDSPDVTYSAALLAAVTGDEKTALEYAKQAVGLGMSLHWFNVPWFDELRQTAAFRELQTGKGGTISTRKSS